MHVQPGAMVWAPTHLLDGISARHIERWVRPNQPMTTFVKSLIVSACLCVPFHIALAGTLDRTGTGQKREPKLLERTERRTPPVDVFAAPAAAAEWLKRTNTRRFEVSVKIVR